MYAGFQRGFSFVEILVTVFIVGVGLLGTGALLAKSLQFNHDSYLRSIATMQAYEISDRIRANPDGLDDGLYNNIAGLGTDPECSSNCTSTEMATQDIYDWNSTNSLLLPSGQGTVINNGAGVFTINVMYDARRTGATGTDCGTDPTVDLTCLTVTVQIQ